MKEISEATGVSITTVIRLLDTLGMEPDYKTLPEVISIDEFKGNSGGSKYHCIIVDPKGGKILDILKEAVYDTLTPEQKEKLEIMFWYSDDLRMAHFLKEEFSNRVLKCKNSKEAKIELKRWMQLTKESKIDEFKRFNRWFEETTNANVSLHQFCNRRL